MTNSEKLTCRTCTVLSKQQLVYSYKFTLKNIRHMTLQHTEYAKNICLFLGSKNIILYC
jgi:hypothetical protein